MTIEYRVTWKRQGCRSKAKRYATRAKAERFMRLFGPEPWLVYKPGVDGDSRVCCSGRECACGGMTFKEQSDAEREKMPPLEYLRLEHRRVYNWKPTEETQ